MKLSACPVCFQPIDPLRSRAIAVVGERVLSFCSVACKDRGVAAPEPVPAMMEPRPGRRPWPWVALASGTVVIAGVLLNARISFDGHAATAALPQRSLAAPSALPPPTIAPPPDPYYGPDPPPPGFFTEGEEWYHPLPGPVRRLPERPSRHFGVGRDHDSPDSCRQGHCGCDVGEVHGEPVLAVHDGVVDRVVLDGDASSGRYVRLLHRNGTFITQYMHLDEVAENLKPGVRVRAGDRVGTVGDSGVHNSGPHLHFTVATRATESAPEVYLDPEPLLSLWPLLPR